MDEKEQKIIQAAANIFMTYGIKSLSMEDIARHLGISKKTLYLYVKDKEELVRKSMELFCTQEDCAIAEITAKNLNAIDEHFEIMKWVLSILRNIHPSVSFDLEKHYPESHRQMKSQRHKAVYDVMYNNIIRGREQGLYRDDFNADIVTKLYIGKMESFFDQELFPFTEYALADVYSEMFYYHIRSIANKNGLAYLEQKKLNSNQNS